LHKRGRQQGKKDDADDAKSVFSPENTQNRAARGGSKGLVATTMMGSAEGGPGKRAVVYNVNININLPQLSD